jgi:hypothetical protein
MTQTVSPYRTDEQIQALRDAAENGESYTALHAPHSAHAGYVAGVNDALAWLTGEVSGRVFLGFSVAHEDQLRWIGVDMTNAAMEGEA